MYLLEQVKEYALAQAGFPIDLETTVPSHQVQGEPRGIGFLLQVVPPARSLTKIQTGIQSD